MSAARSIWFVLVVLVLVVLQFTIRPLLDWRAAIDFVSIAVLLVAVRVRPGVAAIVAFLLGITTDAMSPHAFGAGALALSVVAFAASSLKAAIFADNLALNAVFVFLGKWLGDLVYMAAERRVGAGEFLSQALLWSPLSAAVTALVGVAVFALVRPLLAPARR